MQLTRQLALPTQALHELWSAAVGASLAAPSDQRTTIARLWCLPVTVVFCSQASENEERVMLRQLGIVGEHAHEHVEVLRRELGKATSAAVAAQGQGQEWRTSSSREASAALHRLSSTKPLASWSVSDVAIWLQAVGLHEHISHWEQLGEWFCGSAKSSCTCHPCVPRKHHAHAPPPLAQLKRRTTCRC